MPVSTRETLIREYQDAERTLQKLHQVEQQEKAKLQDALSQLKSVEQRLTQRSSSEEELTFRTQALRAFSERCASDLQILEGQTRKVKRATDVLQQRREPSEHYEVVEETVEDACKRFVEAYHKRLETTCSAFGTALDTSRDSAEGVSTGVPRGMDLQVEPTPELLSLLKSLANTPAAAMSMLVQHTCVQAAALLEETASLSILDPQLVEGEKTLVGVGQGVEAVLRDHQRAHAAQFMATEGVRAEADDLAAQVQEVVGAAPPLVWALSGAPPRHVIERAAQLAGARAMLGTLRQEVERVEGACEGRAATEGDLRRSQQHVLTLVSQRDALSALARGLIAESVQAVHSRERTIREMRGAIEGHLAPLAVALKSEAQAHQGGVKAQLAAFTALHVPPPAPLGKAPHAPPSTPPSDGAGGGATEWEDAAGAYRSYPGMQLECDCSH